MTPEDASWVANVEQEMRYPHRTEAERRVFALVLKWWFKAHGIPVPVEYA